MSHDAPTKISAKYLFFPFHKKATVIKIANLKRYIMIQNDGTVHWKALFSSPPHVCILPPIYSLKPIELKKKKIEIGENETATRIRFVRNLKLPSRLHILFREEIRCVRRIEQPRKHVFVIVNSSHLAEIHFLYSLS